MERFAFKSSTGKSSTGKSWAGATAAAAMAFGLATSAQAVEWDLPLAWPNGNFHVENARTFAKVVGQVTGGAVKINIHPGGSLGFKGPEMLTSIRDGLIPIGDVLLTQQSGENKLLGLEAQPFMTKNLMNRPSCIDAFGPQSTGSRGPTIKKSSIWSRGHGNMFTPRSRPRRWPT